MPAILQNHSGAVLSYINLITLHCKNDRKEHHKGGSCLVHYRWKKDLSAIYTPFYMDSQAVRIHRQEELRSEEISERGKCDNVKVCKETSADKKRKRKKNVSPCGGHLKILSHLRKNLPGLVLEAKEHKILSKVSPDILKGSDNNRRARQAAAVLGCGEVFQDLCEVSQKCGTDRIISLEHGDAFSLPSPSLVIDKLVCNANDTDVSFTLGGDRFLIPSHSRFLTSSLSKFGSHLYKYVEVCDGYDVIIMDPPWTNKSVKRKKSYQTLMETELAALPIQSLTKPHSLMMMWITNNERIELYVKEKLFPSWHVEYVTDWFWMKVTITGVPVLDLDSHHKMPYEKLVIGRVLPTDEGNAVGSKFMKDSCQDVLSDDTPVAKNPGASLGPASDVMSLTSPDTSIKSQVHHHHLPLPKDYILLSVPNALHSKKPPLKDVLQPYLPSNPKCLELFARNLLPGWTSWGNEPLRHQHMDYFEECEESDESEEETVPSIL